MTRPTADETQRLAARHGREHAKMDFHFEGFVNRTGAALHQAEANIVADTLLHPPILGIMLLECSQLTPAENAAVLATSGATTKEGSTVGNSFMFNKDLVARFGAQWDDEALQRRDKSVAPQTCRTFGRCRVIVGAPAGLSNVFSEEKRLSRQSTSGMLILTKYE